MTCRNDCGYCRTNICAFIVGGVIAFLTMFLNFDVPVATVEGFEEVMACIF